MELISLESCSCKRRIILISRYMGKFSKVNLEDKISRCCSKGSPIPTRFGNSFLCWPLLFSWTILVASRREMYCTSNNSLSLIKKKFYTQLDGALSLSAEFKKRCGWRASRLKTDRLHTQTVKHSQLKV